MLLREFPEIFEEKGGGIPPILPLKALQSCLQRPGTLQTTSLRCKTSSHHIACSGTMNESSEAGSRNHTSHEIFLDAVEVPDGSARAEFVNVACHGNAELQREVEHLLEHYSRAGQFLESPLLHREQVCSLILAGPQLAGTRIDGRYRLLHLLGSGGMGQVWLAEQIMAENRHVAVKLLNPGVDASRSLPRFRAELQVLTRLHHPHIATVLDGGITQHSLPFFVMEFVDGKPLCEYCDSHQLSLESRLKLFITICHAVHYAHQQGVIHRDLKPGNLLVEETTGQATPRIIDFGLARLTDGQTSAAPRLTEYGWYLGTPEYMSPEQMTASVASIDARADVYSLGVILFELLTGQTPFRCLSREPAALPDFFSTVRQTDPPRPSAAAAAMASPEVAEARGLSLHALVAGLTGDLDWITLRTLEKTPAARYASAAELAGDIERHLERQPVSAHPPGVFYRLRKLWYRRRSLLASAAVVLSALTAVLAFGTWALMIRQQSSEARDRNADQARAAEEIALTEMRTSLELRQRLATQHHQVGLLLQDLKRLDESSAELRLAAQTFESLIHRFPLDLELRRSHADVLNSLAMGFIRQKKHAEAKGYFEESLKIRERLAEATPDQLEIQNELAITLQNYATTMKILADGSAVLPLHARLCELRKKMTLTDPNNGAYAWLMAAACDVYGDALLQQQDADAAREILEDGLNALQQCMQKQPGVTQHRRLQSKLLSSLADIQISLKCWDQAEQRLRQSLASQSADAHDPAACFFLVKCHTRLARVLTESSRPDQARQELHSAEALVSRLPDSFPDITSARKLVRDGFSQLAASSAPQNP